MTFQDKLYELANRLFVGTDRGTIRWSETADEDSFRAVLDTGLVRVERVPTRQPGPGARERTSPGTVVPVEDYEYSLLVLDDRNRELGRFSPDRPEWALGLRNLWELAGRSARNADQKIDSLLREVAGKVGMN